MENEINTNSKNYSTKDRITNEHILEMGDICNKALQESDSNNSEFERMYEDCYYEELYEKMTYRIDLLESSLHRILELIGD